MKILRYPYYFKKFQNQYLVVNMVGEHVFLDAKDFEMLMSQNYSALSERAEDNA